MRARIRENIHSVYALSDPRDNAVKYVGMAANTDLRLKEHAYWERSPHTPRGRWLEELRQQGIEPVMQVLESNLSFTSAYEREQYWIKEYLSAGAPLKNMFIRRDRTNTQSEQWLIYVLIDPRDCMAHYVGSTKNANIRLVPHINAQRKDRKGAWLVELRHLGLSPEVKVLETITLDGDDDEAEANAKTRVQYWIYKLMQAGAPLVNVIGVTRVCSQSISRRRTSETALTVNPVEVNVIAYGACLSVMALTQYRESLGWSRAELAREAKLDYQTVSKAENGEQITGRSARAIAAALSSALGRTISIQDIARLNIRR